MKPFFLLVAVFVVAVAPAVVLRLVALNPSRRAAIKAGVRQWLARNWVRVEESSLGSAMIRQPTAATLAIYAAGAVVSIITAFHAPFGEPLTDLFHEGEYLAPRLALTAPGADLPLLIHGYLNYLPSQFAEALCGPDAVVACTRAANANLTALASFAFFGCGLALARSRTDVVRVMLSVTAILVLINGRLTDTVSLQQGSPAVRDLTLLAELWCFLSIPGRSHRGADLLASLAGLIAGLGVFWAYNRGVVGVLTIGVWSVASIVCGRRLTQCLAPVAGLLLGLLAGALLDPEMWLQHARNMAYWVMNSGIWRFSLSPQTIAFNSPFYVVVGAGALLGLYGAYQIALRIERRGELPVTLALTAIVFLVIQQAANRGDGAHRMFIVPWLFLLAVQMFNIVRAPPESQPSWFRVAGRHAPVALAALGLFLIDFYASVSVTRPMIVNAANNLQAMAIRMPTDAALTPKSTAQVVRVLKAGALPCTYTFNNAGAFYHLTHIRPCSSVMYPVYASPRAEQTVIADLERARPAIVVGLSSDWFSAIDKKSMKQRTPKLAAWLEGNYPVVERIGGTEIRRPAKRIAGAEPPATGIPHS